MFASALKEVFPPSIRALARNMVAVHSTTCAMTNILQYFSSICLLWTILDPSPGFASLTWICIPHLIFHGIIAFEIILNLIWFIWKTVQADKYLVKKYYSFLFCNLGLIIFICKKSMTPLHNQFIPWNGYPAPKEMQTY